MSRWFSHPWLTSALVLTWLVLQQSMSVGTLVIGLVVALGLSRLWSRLEPRNVHVRSAGKLLVLGARVCIHIVASNWAVACLIVTRRAHTPGFVTIALELTEPAALAVLACIITATPGTLWVSHDSQRRLLVIHVLDTASATALVRNIKQGYEPPLLEVFR